MQGLAEAVRCGVPPDPEKLLANIVERRGLACIAVQIFERFARAFIQIYRPYHQAIANVSDSYASRSLHHAINEAHKYAR
jgi:hypothetical protein